MHSMYIIVLLLLIVVGMHFLSNREGYEAYDNQSCLTLASKNASNIESLQESVNKLMALQDTINTIQKNSSANTSQLKIISDQVFKTQK
jgi:hypothetical protein